MLSQSHQHPRDFAIKFYDHLGKEEHVYVIDGGSCKPQSVTTLIHHYFEQFDADGIINKNYAKWQRDHTNKYYGLTKEQIKAMWNKNGSEASALGTAMHQSIEDFFNGVLNEKPNTVEFKYFESFWSDFIRINPNFKPYRSEWMIYTDSKKTAGSIDMTLENENGEILILDWKRSKEIKTENGFKKKGKDQLCHLEDCNYSHYTLQLNCYRVMLQDFYGKKVKGMYLVILHPDNKNYLMMPVPVLEKEARSILK